MNRKDREMTAAFEVRLEASGAVQPGPGQTAADLPPEHPDHIEASDKTEDEKETDR